MALRQRYIEYHTSNINTIADVLTFKDELRKLLNSHFSLSVTVTAYDNNGDREFTSSYSPWNSFSGNLIKTESKPSND